MINRTFPLALDLGARTGVLRQMLVNHPDVGRKIGTLIEADLAPDMLQGRDGPRMILNPEQWPIAHDCLDLVVASVSLHTVNDVLACLANIRTSLKPDGLFLCVLYGAGTLGELRAALMAAELETSDGAGIRVAPVMDVRDAGGLLQRAGFALPTVDADLQVVRYADVFGLLRDLRAMGETSVLATQAPPLNRRTLAVLAQNYTDMASDVDGRVRATVRLITLTGWAPHASQQTPLRPGSATMGLAEALNGIKT